MALTPLQKKEILDTFPLTKRIEREEQFVNVGISVFLKYIGRKDNVIRRLDQPLFGLTVHEELLTLKRMYDRLKSLRDGYRTAQAEREVLMKKGDRYKITSLDTRIQDLRTQYNIAKTRIQAVEGEFLDKMGKGEVILENMANRITAYIQDQSKLLAIFDEIYGKKNRPKFKKCRDGLQRIIAFYQDIAAKYHGFSGRLRQAFIELRSMSKNNEIATPIDFSPIFRTFRETEEMLNRLIQAAEVDAKKVKNWELFEEYNNLKFQRVLISILGSPLAREGFSTTLS